MSPSAPLNPAAQLAAARRSLDGLSVGDAFGERFFGHPERVVESIKTRTFPAAPWKFTDDTVMAISIVDVLEETGRLDHDRLANLFARRYRHDPARGYGGTAHEILSNIAAGVPWRAAASQPFDGKGSMGNGGAMRSAPIGAYLAHDYAAVVEAAGRSAAVTHAHPDGQAGAIAVAVAAAWVARGAGSGADLFATVLAHTPAGDTRAGIERAARLDVASHSRNAASTLGSGSRVIAADTVPYASGAWPATWMTMKKRCGPRWQVSATGIRPVRSSEVSLPCTRTRGSRTRGWRRANPSRT